MLVILTAACHRRPPQPVVPPPASPSSAALASYDAGEKAFDEGNYEAAARFYAACLKANVPRNQDRIYFRLGLALALAGDNARNDKQAQVHFQQLVAQFPRSPYKPPAELLLSLDAEIEQLRGNLKEQQAKIKALTEELQRLKAIDLKRRPSRPNR